MRLDCKYDLVLEPEGQENRLLGVLDNNSRLHGSLSMGHCPEGSIQARGVWLGGKVHRGHYNNIVLLGRERPMCFLERYGPVRRGQHYLLGSYGKSDLTFDPRMKAFYMGFRLFDHRMDYTMED